MKKFTTHLLKLFAILLGLMIILDYAYNYAFANGIVRSKLQKVLSLEEGTNYEYVFLGSSRTENTIDCDIVEKITGKSCINLGISGSSLADSYLLLQLLNQKKVDLENIFVQVDYSYNGSGLTSFLGAHLIPFKNNPVINSALKKEDDGFYIVNVPFYGYLKNAKVVGFREVINQVARNNTTVNYENGFWPMEGVGQKLYGKLPEIIVTENKDLVQMEYLLEQNDLKLNYFIAPYCTQVENRNFVDKLIVKLPNIQNYVGLFDEKDEYFANCGHINSTGARIFTEVLIRDHLKKRAASKTIRNSPHP